MVGFFVSAYDAAQQDGELPRAAQDHVLTTFEVLDLDGDGEISCEEYAIYLAAIGSDADPVAAFRRLDVEGRGALSLRSIEGLYGEWVSAGEPERRGNYLLTGRLPPE